MKQKKSIYIITVLVIVFSVICCVMPFFTKSELTEKTVISMFGETVELYGKGLYARNSVSCAIQAIAQDMVTLILGPVIIVKAVTLVTAVMAMAICMKISGVEVDMASFFVFGPICIASYIYFFLVMKKIKNLEA